MNWITGWLIMDAGGVLMPFQRKIRSSALHDGRSGETVVTRVGSGGDRLDSCGMGTLAEATTKELEIRLGVMAKGSAL
jgi:hypothetical protein